MPNPLNILRTCVVWGALSIACAIFAPLLPFVLGYMYVRRAQDVLPPEKRWKEPKPVEKSVTTRDGIKLNVHVVKGTSDKVILFCQPLGGQAFAPYLPILYHYGSEFTYITWDYRGLFRSDNPKRKRRIAIPEHSEDGAEVLKALGIECADIVVGHSMGVQVALELCLLYPEKCNKLVLLNGTHGHVFSTAFQPLFRIPSMNEAMVSLIDFLRRHPKSLGRIFVFLQLWYRVSMPVYSTVMGSPRLRREIGPRYFEDFMQGYIGGVVSTLENLRNYLRLFQELHAHSVYHLLPSIHHPTLIVSGMWDCLTPAYQSFEMAKRLKRARHVCDKWSSHATMMENPDLVLREMDSFIEAQYYRRNSTSFDTPKAEYVENK